MRTHTLALALALLTGGCSHPPSLPLSPSGAEDFVSDAKTPTSPGPTTIPLTASKWTEGLSPQYVRFKNNTDGTLYADIPGPGKAWGYAFAPSPSKTLRGTLTARIAMTTLSGTPLFLKVPESGNTCDTPASIRPFIFANRNDWSGEFARWWASDGWALTAPGMWTFAIPLTGDRWSSVFGKTGVQAPKEFAAALANVSSLGFTLGGGCFYGHGIYATGGTARWTLTSYVVQ